MDCRYLLRTGPNAAFTPPPCFPAAIIAAAIHRQHGVVPPGVGPPSDSGAGTPSCRGEITVETIDANITWLAALPFGWNAEEGDENYFEIGIAPSGIIAGESRYPITLTLPVNAGFGDRTYYPGDAFGYASIGISAGMPLAFLPKDFGAWNFAVTGAYYYFGRAPADLSNDGDRHQALISATVITEF